MPASAPPAPAEGPAPPTHGPQAPGTPKAPHLAPASTDDEHIYPLRPLLGMAALVLGMVVLIASLSAVGLGALLVAVAGLLVGVAWVVRTVLRMTADDEPEPTARRAGPAHEGRVPSARPARPRPARRTVASH